MLIGTLYMSQVNKQKERLGRTGDYLKIPMKSDGLVTQLLLSDVFSQKPWRDNVLNSDSTS